MARFPSGTVRLEMNQGSVSLLIGRVVHFGQSLRDRAQNSMRDLAPDAEKWMKENAVWADRTGAARAGLKVSVVQDQDGAAMVFKHTAPHGIWLEIAMDERYAIIGPAIEVFSEELKKKVRGGTVSTTLSE